jgi:hypothetical protein
MTGKVSMPVQPLQVAPLLDMRASSELEEWMDQTEWIVV